ncbi:hypothetical protein D3C80_2157120 [compost metagenome]
MQGINNMDAVAKALRAWTLPYSIPIARSGLFDQSGEINPEYTRKIEMMLGVLVKQV